MSKKPQQQTRRPKLTGEVINHFEDLLIGLNVTYPNQARRYRKATEFAKQAMTRVSPSDQHYKSCKQVQEKCFREAAQWRDECILRCRQITELAKLVAVHFPESFIKFREVRLHPRAWHEMPSDQWKPFCDELAEIERLVITATTPTPAKRKAGRKTLSLDELQRRLDEVDLLGVAEYCRRHDTDPSTISRWRKRVKK